MNRKNYIQQNDDIFLFCSAPLEALSPLAFAGICLMGGASSKMANFRAHHFVTFCMCDSPKSRIPFPNRGAHPETSEDQTQARGGGQKADVPLREENRVEERQSIVRTIGIRSPPVSHRLLCRRASSPSAVFLATFSWYKDGELLEFSHPNYFSLKDDHITIVANAINEGTYTCIVKKKDKVLTNYSWRVRVRF